MNALTYLKEFLAISHFRQNQTGIFSRLMAISAPLFFLFSNPLSASETLPNLDCMSVADCDCSPTGDTEPPTIKLIDPRLHGLNDGDTLYVSCNEQMNFGLNSATTTDNCDPNPSLEFVDFNFRPGNCTEEGFLEEIICGWVASDECGNRDSVVITFRLLDDEPPQFVNLPDSLTVECSNINSFFPEAIDNCNGRLFINRSDSVWLGDCQGCLLYTSPSPRDATLSRMPSSA